MRDGTSDAPKALHADFQALQNELQQIATRTKKSPGSARERLRKFQGPTIFIRGK
ncbi:MAG: hypothetical protein JXB62_15295 [Pirellulales bacterium]|nr:hypothetical protein [Pirellulales bacterium]